MIEIIHGSTIDIDGGLHMKKVAVLLYPDFSNYEMSVAISVLGQAKKPFDVFSLTLEPVRSEEGLYIVPQKLLYELNIEEYDGLLLTGEMDCRPLVTDDRYANFVKQFNKPDIIIGSISSSTALLAKLGMLKDKKYMAGIPEEFLEQLGFQRENYVGDGQFVRDGNVVTAMGFGFVEFGVEFGKALGLDFHPGWYVAKNHL